MGAVRWLACGLCIVAGCYSPSARDCAYRCSANDTCPSGLMCEGSFCRESGATGLCTGAFAVTPTDVALAIGRSVKLDATQDATFQVIEAGGGTITADGMYTAPTTVGTYHVLATSTVDISQSVMVTLTVDEYGVIVLAGKAGSRGYVDGVGALARFYQPEGLELLGNTMFVGDSYTVRTVNIVTGNVSTLAGTFGTFGNTDGTGPAALFRGASGVVYVNPNLYVADFGNQTIRKINVATGAVTTFAGTAGVFGELDGTGTAARFNGPIDIEADANNLYVADAGGNRIRAITLAGGVVTTLAGTSAGCVDDPGGTGVAKFSRPQRLKLLGPALYVADADNQTLRKIVLSTKVVSTVDGACGAAATIDGDSMVARFDQPRGLAKDTVNNQLYLTSLSGTLRRVAPDGSNVTTIAGMAGMEGAVDDVGAAARFFNPDGMVQASGTAYIAEYGNKVIRAARMITGTPVVSTLAGAATNQGHVDGVGTAARFDGPRGIAATLDVAYIAGVDDQTIRKVDLHTGEVTTIAGQPYVPGETDGIGTAATFTIPRAILLDGTTLYIGDAASLRKLDLTTSQVTTIAGGTLGASDGTGTAAQFMGIHQMARVGNIMYVVDNNNDAIRAVDLTSGAVTTPFGALGAPGDIDDIGTSARFNSPSGIVSDGNGNLYVSETIGVVIRKINLSTMRVTTFAGAALQSGAVDASGSAARFANLRDLSLDGTSLVVADDDLIRRVDLSTANVTTVAGTPGLFGMVGGPLPGVLNFVLGVAVLPNGDYLVTDFNENVFVQIRTPPP